MLVVKLELRDPKRQSVKELGKLVIAESCGDEVDADYVAALGEAEQTPLQVLAAPRKHGQVHDHPRKESAWALVAKALRSVGFGHFAVEASTCIISLRERIAELEDVLRDLASYVGNGGYNAPTVNLEQFRAKVRDGIDTLLAVSERRAAQLDVRVLYAEAAISRVRGELTKARKLTPEVSAFHDDIARALDGLTMSHAKDLLARSSMGQGLAALQAHPEAELARLDEELTDEVMDQLREANAGGTRLVGSDMIDAAVEVADRMLPGVDDFAWDDEEERDHDLHVIAQEMVEAAMKHAPAQPPETVICSAIRLCDGRVFRGHRHHDCMRTAHALVEHQEPGSWEAKYERHEQGFITSRNRYVDREEGLRLQKAAGIESACRSGYRARHLFSEDLY